MAGAKNRVWRGFGSGQPTSAISVTWWAGAMRVYVGWNWFA